MTSLVIARLDIRTFPCDSSSITFFSIKLIQVRAQIASVAEFSAPLPPLTASPLPLPSASRQPVPVPGRGPARCVTSQVKVSRWPCRGDVTRGRNHRPPALPPGPLPNRCPLFGVCGCATAPTTGMCQGLLALTQRSPRSGRFMAMRVQNREAHRLRGLHPQVAQVYNT